MASGGLAAGLARAALPVLQRLPPEAAHELALRALKVSRAAWRGPRVSSRHALRLFGREFAHPVGLAAGFDKSGDYLDALGALGFSHVEVGTVTPRPQAGNSKPRLFRVRAQRALINRMGFNNRGADHVAARLRASKYAGIRGVSIGKNADTPLERAVDDYLACLRTLYDVADYFAINVSSPNTRGLRQLQAADALTGIVEPLRDERRRLDAQHGRHVPLLVKISPDLEPAELRELCAALKQLGLEGVIATNTSTGLPGFEQRLAKTGGGVSGAPLTARALEVLRAMRGALGPEFPIISVGGIMSAADAQARLAAGANLLQLYTGFVYRGAPLLGDIVAALDES